VLARPGGPEWGSAGGQMATVVGAEVVAAEEVLVGAELPCAEGDKYPGGVGVPRLGRPCRPRLLLPS
jgi:hypothetical protein